MVKGANMSEYGHHHRHHREHEHTFRIGLLFKSVKELVILSIIKEKPIHGSEIHRILKERYDLAIPKPIIYTLLRRMEDRGLIISEWKISDRGPVKRIYRITEEGLDYLNDSIERLKKLRDMINDLLSKIS